MKISIPLILMLLVFVVLPARAATPAYLEKPVMQTLGAAGAQPFWPYDTEVYQLPGSSGTIKFSNTENGPYTDWIIVTIWTDQWGNGSANYWVKGTVNGSATGQACGYNWIGCYLDETYTVFSINQIQYIQQSSPIDANPNNGCGGTGPCGSRIYPDRDTPAGDGSDRRKVRVKVTLTSAINNYNIYFKSFDLDDWSQPLNDADPNDAGGIPTGGDNRGANPSGILAQVGQTGTTNTLTVATNSSGIAEADFFVTKQPGDNFMVAASGNQSTLNGVAVTTSGTNAGISLKDFGNNLLPTTTAKNTPMLTVWRHLNMEVDNYGATGSNTNHDVGNIIAVSDNGTNTTVTIDTPIASGDVNRYAGGILRCRNVDYTVISNTTNQVVLSGVKPSRGLLNYPFTLWDDDDYNEDDNPNNGDESELGVETLTALEKVQNSDNPALNVFAPVFITPRYNGGGNAQNNGTVTFVLNVTNSSTDLLNQLNYDRQSSGNDDYWISYLQIGYQGDRSGDVDGNSEWTSSPLGGTPGEQFNANNADQINANCTGMPRGAVGSVIFQETIRDFWAYYQFLDPNNPHPNDNLTAPHEIGHQFGLRGDVANYGIMGNAPDLSNFVPKHMHIIRCRVKSLGLT